MGDYKQQQHIPQFLLKRSLMYNLNWIYSLAHFSLLVDSVYVPQPKQTRIDGKWIITAHHSAFRLIMYILSQIKYMKTWWKKKTITNKETIMKEKNL